ASFSWLTQCQRDGRSILPPPQKSFADVSGLFSPKAVFGQLLIWVDHAICLDWYERITTDKSERGILCPFAWNEAGSELPAWPPDMLEAHVLCGMKFVRRMLEVEGRHYLKQQLPSVRLIKCCTSAFSRCCEQISQSRSQRVTNNTAVNEMEKERGGLVIIILQEALLLLKCILDLPAGQEACAAKAAPGTLKTIMQTRVIAKEMKLPEPRVSDDTRMRIEARGNPAQGTGVTRPNSSSGSSSKSKSVSGVQAHQSEGTNKVGAQESIGSPAPSGSAVGPSSSVSISKSTKGDAVFQGEGSSSVQEKQGPSDASRPSASMSSGSKGGKKGIQGQSFGNKDISGAPLSCAEQCPRKGASGSVSEGVVRGDVAEGGLASEPKVGSAGDGAGRAKELERTCGACGKRGKMRVCGKCKNALICSEAC
ncbi:hypothetical protein DUNSADRAFT_438, partial [Dunaliella salina]